MILDIRSTTILLIHAAANFNQSQLIQDNVEYPLWTGNLNDISLPVVRLSTLVWNDDQLIYQLVPANV